MKKPMEKFPTILQSLISHLKKLPGVGQKTAERFAFEFLGWEKEELSSLAEIFQIVQEEIPPCETCSCLSDKGKCFFCHSTNRDATQLCIIASARDAFAIEST
ncbi:MAG: recombination protein RecR, partial [Chlamydiae bacterium]|nr:recombination protein RecR [Chlamydiota bacterium]